MKKLIIASLMLTSCNSFYFTPVTWFDTHGSQEPKTAATQFGDCTTDGQCEELAPGQNYFCYKEESYVGQCARIVERN